MTKNIKLTTEVVLHLVDYLIFFNSLLPTNSEECNSELLPAEIQGLNVGYTTLTSLTSNFVSACHLGALKVYHFTHICK